MKNLIRIGLVATLLVVIASCKNNTNSTKPIRKSLTQAVYASGKLFPINHYKVYSKLPGYVAHIHVKVGDTVGVNQPLVTIKSEISDYNVNTAKNLLELASKNVSENSPMLTSVKQEVASAKTKYELDSTNYARYSNLFKENAISKQQLDIAKTTFDVSKQTYLKAYSTFLSTKDRLYTEYENAKIQYEAQLSNKGDYIISSTIKGRVYDIAVKEGDLANSQLVLMEVGDNKNFEVELSVDETDIGLVKKNQEIVYLIDAFKNETYKGVVVEAYPRISQGNKTSKVIGSIQLKNDIAAFSGLSVEANIIIERKENALVIPREFIIENNKVKVRGTKDLITITKGAEDLEFVEILSGIDEDTELEKK
ncbi:MAG: efflux RND transporter periplasmic adaptor subunit [Bacteroidetes bacterium]|nr:efflux RND transporter periplasmic adaptor subunit [Bacteroidota bacterium]